MAYMQQFTKSLPCRVCLKVDFNQVFDITNRV